MHVFLPHSLLTEFIENYAPFEDAEDFSDDLLNNVGELIEDAFLYFMWQMAVREHNCRLVVVQYADQNGKEIYPHKQIGDLHSLASMHQEAAIEEALQIFNDNDEGVTIDMPFNKETEHYFKDISAAFDITSEDTDILIGAMLLLQRGHEEYLADLDQDMFYIATRGLEKDIDDLLASEHGDWAAKMMGVIDFEGTTATTEIYAEQADGEKNVPLFCQYSVEGEMDDNKSLGFDTPPSHMVN